MENYLISMAVSAGIYALMALGLNVIWGMAGMVNLGLVGFFAVGAYVSALLTLKLGMPIIVGMAAGAVAASLVGVAVTLVTARLRGDYMAIVTLGFAETIRIVASNEIWLTNGTDGLSGNPGPFRSELSPAQFNLVYLCIVSAVVIVAFVLAERLSHAPFGRVLRAIRDDEQVAAVAGKYVMGFKIKAFAAGSAALGLAGALYGHYTSFIAPDIFVPLLTLYIKLSLLAGGLGNNRGAIVGAIVVVFFLESTRFIIPLVPGLSPVQGAALREFLISGALIVLLRWRPGGLLPERIAPLVPPRPVATRPVTAGELTSIPNGFAPERALPPLPSPGIRMHKEKLTLADLAAVQAITARKHAPDEPYQAVEDLAQRLFGHRLFTINRHLPATKEVERVYSNNVKAYPVGGRKQKTGTPWGDKVLDRGEVFIAPDREALRRSFADHELIFSLGIGSIMNVPIGYDGHTLATINISGEAGQYGEADIPAARAMAALLVPVLLAADA